MNTKTPPAGGPAEPALPRSRCSARGASRRGRTRDPAAASGRTDPALIRLAAILLVGGIAAFIDTTVVNVALGAIGRGLHAPVSSVQWVVTGYLLAFAMVIPLSGWALGRFGGR